MALRAVIFGLEGTFVADKAKATSPISLERLKDAGGKLRQLIEFLQARNIRPIIVANHNRNVINATTNQSRPVADWLNDSVGKHSLYIAERDGLPYKPLPGFITAVLDKEELSKNEVLYVGVSQNDFLAALHAKILFLNARWIRSETDYGFIFEDPIELMRFVDLFALKEHQWFYRIDKSIRYRSLAPFSTMREDYREYSEAAKEGAKSGTAERHFFLNTLISSLYFTGEIDDIDYIACVPRHVAGYGNPHMDDVLTLVGKIFGKRYLPDLLVRHKTVKSQREERNAKVQPEPIKQLNSIHLTKHPLKADAERYKAPIGLRGKRILLFDDFTTQGYSMEAARLFLAQAGAEVTMVSWLKTINTNYSIITPNKSFSPYEPHIFASKDVKVTELPYRDYIVDADAIEELKAALTRSREYGKAKKKK